MRVVEPVGQRNHVFVETVVTCLVTADEQARATPWIESVEYAKRISGVLDAEFPHVLVPRGCHSRRAREWKSRSVFLELAHAREERLAFALRQLVPPLSELVGVLDLPYQLTHNVIPDIPPRKRRTCAASCRRLGRPRAKSSPFHRTPDDGSASSGCTEHRRTNSPRALGPARAPRQIRS